MAGLQALAGMHWREFSVLVKRMLREQRGLRTNGASRKAEPHGGGSEMRRPPNS